MMIRGPGRYRGTSAAVGTRHHKEELVGPPLARLGITVVVADVDTDRFGTFTGEIDRPGSPIAVVEAKARAAIEVSGLDLGLASEGSFLPHPEAPSLIVDTELVALVDLDQGLTVIGRALVALAGIATEITRTDCEVDRFCRRVGFPAQGIVVKPADGTDRPVAKGITDTDWLRDAVIRTRSRTGSPLVRLETDLRAHLCPPRRPVIRAAAEDLARRLSRICERCGSPGVGLHHIRPGLPCGLCGCPTRLPAVEVHRCAACSHEQPDPVEGQADPAQCDRCNP